MARKVETSSGEFAVFLGNGINRLGQGFSWEDLIRELQIIVGNPNKVDLLDVKPFPLLYEEIILRAIRDISYREKDVRPEIVELIAKIGRNPYHRKLKDLGVKTFLTTNYDYLIEHGLYPEFERPQVEDHTSELKYSKYRKLMVNDHEIWHIHGETKKPFSILLGYDHYSGYMRDIQNYIKGSREHPHIVQRLKKRDKTLGNTWLSLFFTHDIYIIGFSFDYIEMHLWWLINYRQRLISTAKAININNTIYYFYPRFNNEKLTQSMEAKLQLMTGLGIQLLMIRAKDWDSFYRNMFNRIKKRSN